MKKYGKIQDDGSVMVTDSLDEDFIKKWGFELLELETRSDGKIFPKGKVPDFSDAEKLSKAKTIRTAAVAAIAVEVDGMVFDGDEKAQERMARAVTLADSPEETTEWVLHDNTIAIVTAEQLRKACKLAGKAQTALWTKPYTDTVTVNETNTETNTHYTLE